LPIEAGKLEEKLSMAGPAIPIAKKQGNDGIPRKIGGELDIVEQRPMHSFVGLDGVGTLKQKCRRVDKVTGIAADVHCGAKPAAVDSTAKRGIEDRIVAGGLGDELDYLLAAAGK
jgi:hypothetical protein